MVTQRYEEEVKRKVVNEINDGATIPEVRKKYNIKGAGTVENWVKKYQAKIRQPRKQKKMTAKGKAVNAADQLNYITRIKVLEEDKKLLQDDKKLLQDDKRLLERILRMVVDKI